MLAGFFGINNKFKAGGERKMNTELMEALDILEKEKDISRDTLFEAIENSLITACRNNYGRSENIHVTIDRETCDYIVYVYLISHMSLLPLLF